MSSNGKFKLTHYRQFGGHRPAYALVSQVAADGTAVRRRGRGRAGFVAGDLCGLAGRGETAGLVATRLAGGRLAAYGGSGMRGDRAPYARTDPPADHIS